VYVLTLTPCFCICSEVLLSSEARVITYVSKTGQRSEHSLDDVLQTGAIAFRSPSLVVLPLLPNAAQLVTGRVDIAKRLKYTKDIMYRLINTQQK
jgi:hypothetical protein